MLRSRSFASLTGSSLLRSIPAALPEVKIFYFKF